MYWIQFCHFVYCIAFCLYLLLWYLSSECVLDQRSQFHSDLKTLSLFKTIALYNFLLICILCFVALTLYHVCLLVISKKIQVFYVTLREKCNIQICDIFGGSGGISVWLLVGLGTYKWIPRERNYGEKYIYAIRKINSSGLT